MGDLGPGSTAVGVVLQGPVSEWLNALHGAQPLSKQALCGLKERNFQPCLTAALQDKNVRPGASDCANVRHGKTWGEEDKKMGWWLKTFFYPDAHLLEYIRSPLTVHRKASTQGK